MGKKKGVTIGLGEFIGGETNTIQDRLPSGPRARQEGEDNYRGGGRRDGGGGFRSQRAETPSEEASSWRGGGGSSSFGGSSFRGSSDRFSRDAPPATERPSHMRLNLSRRGDNAPAPPATTGGKWASAFRGGNSSSSSTTSGDVRTQLGSMSLKSTPSPFAAKEEEMKIAAAEAAAKKKAKAEEKRKAKEEKKAAQAKAAAEEKAKKEAEEAAAAKRAAETASIVKEIVGLREKGTELVAAANAVFKKSGVTLTGAELAAGLLPQLESAKTNAEWTSLDQYGALFASLVYEADANTAQLEFLYEIQKFMNSLTFPRGLIEKIFMACYQNDIVDEDGFIAYKYDVNDEIPGKMNAIIQLTQWLSMLEAAAEEDEDDEEEDDDYDLHQPQIML